MFSYWTYGLEQKTSRYDATHHPNHLESDICSVGSSFSCTCNLCARGRESEATTEISGMHAMVTGRRWVRHRGFSCFCMRMVVMSCLLASYLGSNPAQASFVLAMRSRRSGLSDWALISLAMHRHLELGCNKYSMFHDSAMKGMAPILANVLS